MDTKGGEAAGKRNEEVACTRVCRCLSSERKTESSGNLSKTRSCLQGPWGLTGDTGRKQSGNRGRAPQSSHSEMTLRHCRHCWHPRAESLVRATENTQVEDRRISTIPGGKAAVKGASLIPQPAGSTGLWGSRWRRVSFFLGYFISFLPSGTLLQ